LATLRREVEEFSKWKNELKKQKWSRDIIEKLEKEANQYEAENLKRNKAKLFNAFRSF